MRISRSFLPFIFMLLVFRGFLFADEGMWIPLFLKELNEDEMKAMGMRLNADEIYSINQASMKDAVVLFGRGCTAEIVSDQGLILTNHHCGYGRIQAHSSIENDYLTHGFWAMNQNEELSNPGLEASILVYMKDVTKEVFDNVNPNTSQSLQDRMKETNIEKLVKDATKGTHYVAKVVPFYYGNQYILMVYEVFKDVRLVGAPPSCVGKFGGDTDNWMWPRHTGDFTWFRIYADSNNQPAEYSKDNVPYKPNYSFTISLKGVEEGDFTFVFGYPGTTNQYATSHAVKMITQTENPIAIEMRRKRMDVMEKFMVNDELIRIQYSAKHAGVANYWKKMIGENKGILRTNGMKKKQELESRFSEWVEADDTRKEMYGGLFGEFAKIYEELTPANLAFTVFFEGGYSIELVKAALQFNQLYQLLIKSPDDKTAINKEIDRLKTWAEGFYKDYSVDVDREMCYVILPYYSMVDKKFAPAFFERVNKDFNNSLTEFTTELYEKSMFASKEKVMGFLNNFSEKKAKKTFENDPGFVLMTDIINNYRAIIAVTEPLETRLQELYKTYVRALMEMDSTKRFWPDANSTLRVTYGKVSSYIPFDGVKYQYYTSTSGIIEKSLDDAPDYVIEDKLSEFLKSEDWGPYAHSDGTMRVGFVASNHTTGGNSGSPVLNADGHLVGINFDRVWEGTMSDLFYDVSFCRNVSVDIRYVLLITDRFAGAGHLLDEMKIER
jgi:hypothetical protein